MKRKYYMRGLGIGVLVTAILCGIVLPGKKEPMTDEEVIARAKALGYVKEEGGVTAEDIDKLKENEKAAGTPGVSKEPEVTGESDATPGPTPSPVPTPEAPNPPDKPDKPASPTPGITAPEKTPSPKPTATNAPTVTNTSTVTEAPARVPTKAPETDAYMVKVERGMTASKVAGLLEKTGVIKSAEEFVDYLRKEKLTDLINVGTFTIPSGASYEEIGKILTEVR